MKKNAIILLYFLSPLGLIFTLVLNQPAKYLFTPFLVPTILGAFAYTWFLWQFIISARPKYVETSFGLDKLYRIHSFVAIAAVGLTLIHKFINEDVFGEILMTKIGSIALYIFIAVGVVSFVFFVNSFVTAIPPFKTLRKWVDSKKLLKYEGLRWFHNTTVIALIVLQVHVLMTSSAQSSVWVFNVYMAYFSLAFGFYLYQKIFKPWAHFKELYEITRVVSEAPKFWSVYFKVQGKKHFPYLPGQFGFYRFLSSALPDEEHPFSLSSSPLQDEISITVKELGDFTSKIGLLKPGNLVSVEAPYGRFSYTLHTKEKAYIFIAGGVGITPILSMLRHMRDTKSTKPVLLLWGMNTLADYICKDELTELLNLCPNIRIIPVVAFDKTYSGEQGFIDIDKLNRYVGIQKWKNQAGYYVCGPAVLMNSTIKNLKSMGISAHRIHHEKFSL